MSKVKYRFNTISLKYEKVKVSMKARFLQVISYLATGIVFAFITILLANKFLSSPLQKKQTREIEGLKLQYDILNKKMNLVKNVLDDLQDRDDNIYRVIFEAEPIPSSVRLAGFGGSDRYKELEGFDNSDLMIETTKNLDIIAKQLYIQSKSYDEVIKMARGKEKLLASIPAIMPLNNKNLKHAPSGFGWRTHPIYKTKEFHPGMDFTAEQGTPVYATGDGVIESANESSQGYGNHVVINHGFGYQTLYGHMSKIATKLNLSVKRGDLIGYIGSTGLSTGPHLHYEVIKNGEKVNPINFYYNDLSPEEYQIMLDLSTKSTQSYD
ncbi:MAG: M23 family metallopeptidase [Bacteroidota bacterium]|jgi:murein DD-endopeptidase MepM/ murein hydrolase activator NlpD